MTLCVCSGLMSSLTTNLICRGTLCTCTLLEYYAEVDLEVVARGTPGFSGADLANLINQAALHGSALGREAVVHEDLDFAK